MSHYFIEDPSIKNHEFHIKYRINDVDFDLLSNNGVFSKSSIDKGTYFFLQELVKLPLSNKVLDLGCGYGVVGLTLKVLFPKLDMTMVDINPSCLNLVRLNVTKYGIEAKIIESNSYSNLLDHYDYVLLNPPISCGKEIIYNMYRETYVHLNDNGHFLIVIRKDKGALSHKKYLETLFNKVSILNKDKGYLIIESIK
ncbi:MAG: methyltransferase [Bacilli bacterium]